MALEAVLKHKKVLFLNPWPQMSDCLRENSSKQRVTRYCDGVARGQGSKGNRASVEARIRLKSAKDATN